LKAASTKPAAASGALVKRNNQICVVIIAGVLLFVSSIASTFAATVDEVVASEMEKHGVTGVSLAIIEHGKIIEAKGYGFTDKSRTTAVTTNTLFQAGSVSKPVAALAALRLVEAGKLALDEDANRYLKQWRVPENKFTKDEKVTLRRILSHSAGLTVHGFPGYSVDSPRPSLRQVLDGSRPANTPAIRVDVVPGTIFRYSGGGYTVMQQLMIDVSGETFTELMRECVLTPLGMSASTYEEPLPADRVGAAATGYYSNGEQVTGRWHIYPEMAAAGLWTTPSDLARFVISVQEGLAGKSNPTISQSMIRQMLTVQKGHWGLGLLLTGRGKLLRFSHQGRDEGFDTFMMGYAESGQGVVIMINANDDSGVMGHIVDAVRQEYHRPEAGGGE
jgi:CubicO group peptidase (beta-lactamase class C family)